MRNKTYISGQITGLPIEVAEKRFKAAQDYLEAQGHTVINPMTLGKQSKWEDYMRQDIIVMLQECDKIAMLPGFGISVGANIEFNLAQSLNFMLSNIPEYVVEHIK